MSRKPSFASLLSTLRTNATRFDAAAQQTRKQCLQALSDLPLPASRALVDWHELLLFCSAHPASAAERRLVEREIGRFTDFIRTRGRRLTETLDASGLPYAYAAAKFTHDFVRWLLAHPHCKAALDSFGDDAKLSLNDVLKLTLPSLERAETTAGLGNLELLDALGIRKHRRLAFLVDELANFDAQPYLKDQLFDALDVYVGITPTKRAYSRAYNRLRVDRAFVHTGMIKHFDAIALLDRSLPQPKATTGAERDDAIRIVRNAMALTDRETDPATYLDPGSFRLYRLERGIAVAIFGMVAQRQLPLESYVGFTLFKNGFPAAYGGSWLFGRRARFGMNIFETFRGGESGLMMCEVLRVYRQAFGIDSFTVAPYMYGLDNPEGIDSGAFWFYYKHGFRPEDRALLALAEREQRRIASKPGHRTARRTLLRFTEGSLALKLRDGRPHDIDDLSTLVGAMIRRRFGGDRRAAVEVCVARFCASAHVRADTGPERREVLTDVALLAEALAIDAAPQLARLAEMVWVKPTDVYAYQPLLGAFLDALGEPRRARRAQ